MSNESRDGAYRFSRFFRYAWVIILVINALGGLTDILTGKFWWGLSSLLVVALMIITRDPIWSTADE